MKTSVVQDKSYAFALRIIAPAKWLRAQKELELASQILRVGTAIGSNAEEALAGISRVDFIAKMAVASKEARETRYWLRLLRDANMVPIGRITPLENECSDLVRILTAIVKTSQTNTVNSKLRT